MEVYNIIWQHTSDGFKLQANLDKVGGKKSSPLSPKHTHNFLYKKMQDK